MLFRNPGAIAGRVEFADLRGVVADLIAVWSSVQNFVKRTGPRHFKTIAGRVMILSFHSTLYVLSFAWLMVSYFVVVIGIGVLIVDNWLL